MRRRRRASVERARFESLESRALLAITGLPTAGAGDTDLLNKAIVLATDLLGPNKLDITLQDKVIGGTTWAVATITANIPGGTTVSRSYYNFQNSISFAGTFDSGGGVANDVTLTTPFGFGLANPFGGTPYDWTTVANFAPRAISNVTVALTNADSLALSTPSATLLSTVTGTFTSPTLAPTAGLPGADIKVNSTGPVNVLAGGVSTYNFTYTGTGNAATGNLQLLGAIKTTNDITITDTHDITIDQPLTAAGAIAIVTPGGKPPAGNITVNRALTAGGAVVVNAAQSLTTNNVIASTAAGVKLTSGNGNVLTVNEDVTATNGDLELTGDGGIVTKTVADLLAVTGAVRLTSAQGFVNAAGSLTATANAVSVTATKLAATTSVVTALNGFTMTAGTDARVGGATTVTGDGDVTVTGNNNVTVAAAMKILGGGGVSVTATNANLAVLPSSPISVTNGKTTLVASKGTASVEAQVVGNLAITVQADQGIVLSNAVDTTAELLATGANGSVTITNTANQVLIDAPVTSQVDAVAITCTKNDIDVRDDVFALGKVTITGNTKVTVNGAPALVTLTSQTDTISVTSTLANVVMGPNLAVVAGPGQAAGVAIAAGTVVDLEVAIVAQGDIAITSPDSFVVLKALTSNLGKITITSASGPLTSVVAPITASGAVAISGNDSVVIDNTITSTLAGISLTSSGGFVTLASSSQLVAANVVTGTIAVTAAGTFAMGNDFTAGNNITVTAGTSFAPVKNFTSVAGNVAITTTIGALDVTGAMITAAPATGNVTLASAGNLVMDLAKIIVGTATGSLSATAGAGLTVTSSGPISVVGSLTLSSTDPTVGFKPAAGADLFAKTGSISLNFGGTIDVSAIDVQAPSGSATLVSKTGDVIIGAKKFVVEPAATGAITLSAPGGAVTLGQALAAGSNISISSLKTLQPTFGLATVTGGVSLTSAGGDVDVSGPGVTITAPAGTIALTAPAGSVLLGSQNFAAGTGFSATCLNTLTVNAEIKTTTGDLTLTSTANDVALTGTADLIALGGAITLFANGEINNGKPNNGGDPLGIQTLVQANKLVATARGGVGGIAPVFAFTNKENDVAFLEVYLQTAAVPAVPIGGGITWVDANDFTVNGLVSSLGDVSLKSVNGSLTVNAAIGGAPATLANVALTTFGTLTVNGAITATGNVTATSDQGDVTLNGSVTSGKSVTVDAVGSATVTGAVIAGATGNFKISADLAIAVTGAIFAGIDVIADAGTSVNLGGPSVTASTGNVSVTSTGTGGITVAGTVSALLGGITITTPDAITFNGSTLTAAKPYTPGGTTGLIRIQGKSVTVTNAPTIWGGRLELKAVAMSPVTLTGNNSVDSLGVSTAGSFTFTNFSQLLEITDFDPTTATVQVSTGGNLTITQSMLNGNGGRLRVVDGLSYGGVLSLSANQSALGVEFVTTSAGDNPGNPPTFAGTLRDMLRYINANTATNGTTNATMSAVFDEPNSPVAIGGTIAVKTAALPNVSKRILFDGSLPAAGGGGIGGDVGLDGVGIKATVNGLTFVTGSGGSTIQDVAIGNFRGAGVELQSGDNTVISVQSGFDRLGGVAGNGVGIRVTGAGAARNFVGTTAVGNVIGNNTGAGLVIQGGATYTSVLGNFIGVLTDGVTAAVNGGDGIQIVGGKGNVIGQSASTAGANLISNNRGNGVTLLNVLGTSLVYGTRLFNNTISGNTQAGVAIQGGGYNQVGTTAAGNTIQGNGANGVALTAASASNVVMANTVNGNVGDGVLVDTGVANRISANTLSNNTVSGARIRGATVAKNQATNLFYSNTVQANGNAQANGGIVLENSFSQVIGVDPAGKTLGNTVANNFGSGIVILNGTGTLVPQSNAVVGNSVTGSTYDGIRVQGSLGNLIQGNTASMNGQAGIAIVNAAAANPTDPRFSQGNVVVANVAGGNTVGILVQGASTNTTVGGMLVSLGNRAYGNTSHGISLESLVTGTPYGTRVQNNVIGLDTANATSANGGNGLNLVGASGTVVNYANTILNSAGAGISIVGGSGNTIGSPVAGRSNRIMNNAGDGIAINQPAAPSTALTTGIVVSGNRIDSNAGSGISVTGSRTSNVVIGRAPSITVPTGDENTITNNGNGITGDGIRVDAATGVTMIGNQFTNNTGNPIALLNNANGGILPPTTLTASAKVVGGRPQWTVSGTVKGTAGQSFYVDVYDSNLTYLGRVLATVGKTGTGTFRAILTGKAGATGPLRATCTLANPSLFGGTSQFSS